MGNRLAGSPSASPRHLRGYSPFNRTPGLRHLPDDRLRLSFVCSLLLHALLVILMVRVTDVPAGGAGAAVSSVLSWVDLTAPDSARGTSGPASARTSAARTMPRSGSPARHVQARPATLTPAGPPRAAIIAATRPQVPITPPPSSPVPSKTTQDQPTLAARDTAVQGSIAGRPSMPEGDKPLGSARPAAASEVVAFDPGPSVVAPALMPQSAKTLTTIPTIDGRPLDQRVQAPPSLKPTPKVESKALAEPRRAETNPDAAAARPADPPTDTGQPSVRARPHESEASPPGPMPSPAGERQVLTAALRAPADSPMPAEPSPVAEPHDDASLVQPSTPPTTNSASAALETGSTAGRLEPPWRGMSSPTSKDPPSSPVTSDPRPGSAVGLGPRRVKVRFDGPRARTTDKDIATVTGAVADGTPDRLVLYVNDVPMEVTMGNRSFQTSVPLQVGLNQLRAVATGPEGLETQDSISIEYAPPASSNGVALTSPADGLIVTPEDPPVVVVEGRIDDKSATTVWLVANDRRIPVRAADGQFRKVLPVFEPTLRLWAETSRAGEPGSRSQIVTVHTTGPRRPAGVLVMEWPRGTQGLDVEVSALWRPHPERLDEPAQPIRLTGVLRPSNEAPFDVFWLRNVRPGVCTMLLRYRGLLPNGEVHPTLYLPDGDGLTGRAVRPIRLEGTGKAVLARVLLPHGVLWEQDAWFSGSSESVDTVTKFRFPEGINWVERKADLQ